MIVSFILFLLGISEIHSFRPRQTWQRCTKVFVSSNHQDTLVSALEVAIRRKDHVTFGKLLLANKIQSSGENSAAVAPVPADMTFLLLLNALQRSIKPGKKRMTQSMTLLSAAQDAGIDNTIVDICFQVLCIATTEQTTTHRTSSRNNCSHYCHLLQKGLGTYTHFWDSVQAVRTESKQRPNWSMDETNRRPLDLVTSLAVIDAMVKDVSFGLLAMQILRSVDDINPTSRNGMVRKSLYVEAYHFLQHIITDNESPPSPCSTTNSAGNRIDTPSLHAFIARTVLPDITALSMGVSLVKGVNPRSLAVNDDVTAIVSKASTAEPTTAVAGSASTTAIAIAIAVDHEESEDRRLSSVIARTDDWPRYGCFIDALFACTSPSSPSSSSSSSSSSFTATPSPDHRATRVLVLGDGDLSFSAALSNAAAHATSNSLYPLCTPDDHHPDPSPGLGATPSLNPGAGSCLQITATTLESNVSLYRKYAGARANHLDLLQQQQRSNTTQVRPNLALIQAYMTLLTM